MSEEKKVLAEVAGKKITQGQVINFIKAMQNGQQFMNPKGIKQITDELVNQELLYIDALEKGLDKDKEFVDEVEFTKSNMLKNYAMHMLFKDIDVSEQELKNYYDNNKEAMKVPETFKAKHILVNTLEQAEKIFKEIEDGKSFEEAADEYSLDKQSKNGGDLGEFPKGTMVKEFEEALEKLDEGEVSKPVKTQFGYHLIKLDHKHEPFLPEFEQIKDRLRETLIMIRSQEKYLKEVEKISKKVDVKKYY
ncbi:MAG: peptidylprolyl isomerase [Peptoniphilaceae bacterium]|nr:peptidylprolyl isomerase [Peptoniphilaceae bacterium]MDY6018670.1 peptidylprolyl isomerase [Anaerococcus sp.]